MASVGFPSGLEDPPTFEDDQNKPDVAQAKEGLLPLKRQNVATGTPYTRPTTIWPIRPARMTFAEAHSATARKKKKDRRMRIAITVVPHVSNYQLVDRSIRVRCTIWFVILKKGAAFFGRHLSLGLRDDDDAPRGAFPSVLRFAAGQWSATPDGPTFEAHRPQKVTSYPGLSRYCRAPLKCSDQREPHRSEHTRHLRATVPRYQFPGFPLVPARNSSGLSFPCPLDSEQ
jgi:hypothetical protein